MGLSANVRCRCWELGLFAKTPLSALLEIDEDGYLDLREPERDDDHLWHRMRMWQRTACVHPEMKFIDRHLANWRGVGDFVTALMAAGSERFPTLLHEIPSANGGLTTAVSAVDMLAEMRVFSTLRDLGREIVLLDSDSGETIENTNRESPYFFSLSPNERLGLSEEGFLIVRDDRVVFRSTRFAQDVLEIAGPDGSGETRFRSCDDGAFATARIAVGVPFHSPEIVAGNPRGHVRHRFPENLHVELRAVTPGDFDYIVERLTELCEAAIETGNPIRWC